MKKIYCLFLLISCVHIHSQTLTQSFNEPSIGDVDKNYRLDTSAYTNGLPLNVTGNNCTWNFTNINGIFPMIVDSFLSPVGIPSSTAYPSASYVQHRDNLYTYYKSTTSPQQTELLGAYTPTLAITFTNSGIIAGYPVNYGYSVSDPVGGTFKYNTTNGVCIGNITISADGLGTVNLPNNVSIPNVLRLKSVETLTLSTSILPVGTFSQTIYNYYQPGRKFPILNLNYTAYQLLAGTPTITAFVYGSNNYFVVAGVEQNILTKESFNVFPNPFHDQLFITAKNQEGDNEFLFYDLNGRTVLKTKSATDNDIEKLVPGVYFLEIKNERGSFHQKIIKE